jgi:ATP-dependent exoDNAse (exonuclease V) alpha subunit
MAVVSAYVQAATRVALEKICERQSHFSSQDLLRVTATETLGQGVPAKLILRQVEKTLKDPRMVVQLGTWNRDTRYATPEMLALEKRLLDWVDVAKRQTGAGISWDAVAKTLQRHAWLKPEQRVAVAQIAMSEQSIMVLQGLPGTGKTTALSAVRDVFSREDYTIYGTSLAGKAARGLETETGIKSKTIASLLHDFEKEQRPWATMLETIRMYGMDHPLDALLRELSDRHKNGVRLKQKTLLVVDEAGMLDTRTMFNTVSYALSRGAKILLVGDRHQLQPIGAGGPFGAIADRLGASRLSDIARQRESWQIEAIRAIQRGEGGCALQEYAQRGLLTIAKTRSEARKEVIEAWKKEGVRNPEDNLILAARKDDVARLNQLAQAEKRRQGEVGGIPRALVRLSASSIRINKQRFYLGDRIVCTRTTRRGLHTGDLGTIVRIDKDNHRLVVQFDTETKRQTIDLRYYQDLALGYAVTTHRAQGMTVENAFILVGGSMQDREQSFVQASRARGQTRLFSDQLEAGENLETMRRQFELSRQKNLAHDVPMPRLEHSRQVEQTL